MVGDTWLQAWFSVYFKERKLWSSLLRSSEDAIQSLYHFPMLTVTAGILPYFLNPSTSLHYPSPFHLNKKSKMLSAHWLHHVQIISTATELAGATSVSPMPSPWSQTWHPISSRRPGFLPPSAARTYGTGADEVQGCLLSLRGVTTNKGTGTAWNSPSFGYFNNIEQHWEVHLSEQGQRAHPGATEHPTHPSQSSPPHTKSWLTEEDGNFFHSTITWIHLSQVSGI